MLRRVLAFGAIAAAVVGLDRIGVRVHLPAGVHETSGAVLALVLAFRTNTGYNRFWEGRTLWGSIVNVCRNLARVPGRYAKGEADETKSFKAWLVVFAHVTRRRLRAEADWPEVERLLAADDFAALRASEHPSLYAAERLSDAIARWTSEGRLSPLFGEYAERLVATLVDNLGGCERIHKTPTPLGFVLLLERFVALYLATLPFMLVTRVEALAPVATVLVAYPILLIDALGAALDDPFGHDPSDLPLTRICLTIEKNLLGTEPPPQMLFPTATPYDD